MSRFRHVVVVGGLAALWVAAGLPVASQMPQGGATLRGVVKAGDGKPLEGVAVSARAQGSTLTTSVWTNQRGEYSLPPLPDGAYRVWAQAVGFTRTVAEQKLAPPSPEVWLPFQQAGKVARVQVRSGMMR